MRFLADMGVANLTMTALRELGHDVVHARQVGYHTLLDADILAHARSQTRIVVTFDLDFGDLLAAAGESLPSVILVRTHNQRAEAVTPRVLDVAERFVDELEAGALLVVEDAASGSGGCRFAEERISAPGFRWTESGAPFAEIRTGCGRGFRAC